MVEYFLLLHLQYRKNTLAEFIGEYHCKIDGKGRVMLPSKLRAQIPENNGINMVVNRSFEKCLALFTKDDWTKETEKLKELNEFHPKARKFIRQFRAGATLIQVDGASRINLPKNLIEYAELKGEIVLSSSGGKIEIWSKANYEKEFDFDAEQFAEAAEELFGGWHNSEKKE
mgnify:CR=1 FL=1